jgi:phosphatidylglycerophosphate synthase
MRSNGVQGPFFTAANAISLARIPLAGAAVACLALGERTAAQVLLVAAFLTDALDGAVARATKSTSEWGRILDPMADKLVFAVIAVALAWMHLIPWWLAAAIVGRDLVVIIGGLRHIRDVGHIPEPNIAGKLSTLVLAAYLCKQAFWPAPPLFAGLDPLGWIAVAVLAVSTIAYGLRYLAHRRDTLAYG